MTAAAAGSGGRGGRGRTGLLILAVIGGILAVVWLGDSRDSGRPYDLDSAGDLGYRGLRLTVEELGGSMRTVDAADLLGGSLDGYAAIFVVGGSGLAPAERDAVLRYARTGGRVVVAGGTGDGLGAPRAAPPLYGAVRRAPGECTIDELSDVRAIDPAEAPGLSVGGRAEACFTSPRDGTALVVREPEGDGDVVSVASPDLFTNLAMRPHDQDVDDPKTPMADNVVVAARVLRVGPSRVIAVVQPALPTLTEDRRSAWDFVRPGVKAGLWQLLVAFVIYAAWRTRRHGRVVRDPRPVEIAGSDLTRAVGNLYERQGRLDRALDVVRRDVWEDLCDRLGVPRTSTVTSVATLTASRSRRHPTEVAALLAGRAPSGEEDLIRIVQELESIRQEVVHGRPRPEPAER